MNGVTVLGLTAYNIFNPDSKYNKKLNDDINNLVSDHFKSLEDINKLKDGLPVLQDLYIVQAK